MSIATLADIILKVRKLIGAGNPFQLTDSQIIDYINSFYLYDFPAQFRSLKLKDRYTFNTVRGIDIYPFDSEHYTTVQSPCYCMKRIIPLYQQPWGNEGFWGSSSNWQFEQILTEGNGTNGAMTGIITNITQATSAQVTTSTPHGLPSGALVMISGVFGMTQLNGNSYIITVVDANDFTLNVNSFAFTPYISGGVWTTSAYMGTLENVPIIRSTNNNPMVSTPLSSTLPFPAGDPVEFPQANISRVQNILITANSSLGSTQNVTDDGAGNLIGGGTGVINYETGQLFVTFTNPVPDGHHIRVMYSPTVMSVPLSIMFFQNQFTLRPVPDQGYTIELIAYRQPSQALLGTLDPDIPITTGVPELKEWWELIATGAAKKFFEEQQDVNSIQVMDKILFERYAVAEARTYAQIGSCQRIGTIYAAQMSNGNGCGDGYGGIGGFGQ
jgi:Ubiquitin-activating enzyme E1 FCCH domain